MRGQSFALGLVMGLALGLAVGMRFKENLVSALSGNPATPTVAAVNPRAFDAVLRAANATEQTLVVGASLNDFMDRVQTLATEGTGAIAVIRTEQEAAIMNKFGDATQAYADSLNLWRRRLGSNKKYFSIGPELVARYKIPDSISITERAPQTGESQTIYDIDAVNRWIWTVASQRLSEARQMLRVAEPG